MEEKILYSMESPFQQEINVKGYYFGKNEGKELHGTQKDESGLLSRKKEIPLCRLWVSGTTSAGVPATDDRRTAGAYYA